MALSESNCIVAAKQDPGAQIALSSLIHALYENDLIALARLVTKAEKPPVLVALAPSIETNIECLVDVQVQNCVLYSDFRSRSQRTCDTILLRH
jgi:ATP-dependent DNA helicase 2 subunit 2